MSNRCKMIQQKPCNKWVFEVMSLHQGLERFRNCCRQRWCFNKKGDDILILCYGASDKPMVFLEGNIGNHQEAFENLIIYVVDGKYLLPEEYDTNLTKQASTVNELADFFSTRLTLS